MNIGINMGYYSALFVSKGAYIHVLSSILIAKSIEKEYLHE